mmetsp:Transcript_10200/g.15257  ORF Transcript_10200/g.15257 Transcript_10200/m.15257 type:complete len:151 (+) Transcript_10200:266-718(+)
MLASAKKMIERTSKRKQRYTSRDNLAWVLRALLDLGLKGKKVVNYGSLEPFYEVVCLALGAQSVTTIEYNRLTYDNPQLFTATPKDIRRRLEDGTLEKFDVALSISSFDHDGLGRYGDPIDPNGDLRAMQEVKDVLQPTGILVTIFAEII